MTQYTTLVKRNMTIYLRDKGAVFFSLLSMLIIIVISMLFLGDVNAETIADILSQLPNRDVNADKENAKLFFLLWTVGGVISINAATVTVAVYSVVIKDKTDGISGAISTSAVSGGVISAAYVTSAFLCSVIICSLTLAISEIYCIIQGVQVFSLTEHLQLFGMIAINSFAYSAITYFLASLIKTEGAWSGAGTLIGTLIGFLGGIYIPLGTLAPALATVLKCLPAVYGVRMFRDVMLTDITARLFEGAPDSVRDECLTELGVTFDFMSTEITNVHCIAVLAVWGVVFLALSVAVSKKR